ncbi:unnamed protein product, partial [Didymodactylos carnosus]
MWAEWWLQEFDDFAA